MSSLLLSTLTASSTQEKLYVDDVFSAYTYTGNGATQTINNGIDLAGKGGLVWGKGRSAGAAYNHRLQDTANGVGTYLSSNTTTESTSQATGVTAFNSDGYTLGSNALMNQNNETYVSWTFRRAERFFDVVTYTGDGTGNRQIAHGLGVAPGMIVVKSTSTSTNWVIRHRLASGILFLNTSDPQATHFQPIPAMDASTFTVGAVSTANDVGVSYVAYLFAHDPSADGIIQCGSFTTDASGNFAPVNLGWEPQYVLIKSSSSTGHWNILDNMRGMAVGGNEPRLFASTAWSEDDGGAPYNWLEPTATGFSQPTNSSPYAGSAQTYIYLAIRRPNKPPTSGTQVYNAIARTGTGAAATVTGVGFAPDLSVIKTRNRVDNIFASRVQDRLRGARTNLYFELANADAPSGTTDQTEFLQDGVAIGNGDAVNASGVTYINHFFRRAPGFFDVVCYTGTGSELVVPHNLQAIPELYIFKTRGISAPWYVIANSRADTLVLNGANASSGSGIGTVTAQSTTNFTLSGPLGALNMANQTQLAYLFASCAGTSKVGSYTGNGSSQTIDCGFSTGARFFLVKATSTTGSWWVFDSARGIVSSFDPALQLNSTAAEITSADAVDPTSVGIIVNQEATCSINASGVNYVYLAIS